MVVDILYIISSCLTRKDMKMIVEKVHAIRKVQRSEVLKSSQK